MGEKIAFAVYQYVFLNTQSIPDGFYTGEVRFFVMFEFDFKASSTGSSLMMLI